LGNRLLRFDPILSQRGEARQTGFTGLT